MSGKGNAPAIVVPLNNAAILVSEKQRGNPLLRLIRNCPFEFNRDIIPDYVMGSTCAIFLSLKYHLLHPRHAEVRIKELGRSYKLRVLLVLVDDDNNVHSLQELNKLCFSSDVTLILAWSNEECARYLETLKLYENKDASAIKEKVENEFIPQLNKVLTNVRSVNKTDVVTLLEVFGTLSGICQADEQQLLLCPGLGDKKVKRLYQALHEPFKPREFTDVGMSADPEDHASRPKKMKQYKKKEGKGGGEVDGRELNGGASEGVIARVEGPPLPSARTSSTAGASSDDVEANDQRI